MVVNYTPDYESINGNMKTLKPFRFWCQKVLPLVYDDSLSYYELLNKVVQYLNDTMENVDGLNDNVNTLDENVRAIYQAYNQLQDYVNNYFDNLDVQVEINNKLDAMVLDGTLSTLISPIVSENIPDIVSDWLEENIQPTTPVVDETLSISGAAADSKVTGDDIYTLKSNLTDSNYNGCKLFNPTWVYQAYNPDTGQKINDPNQTQISTNFIYVGLGNKVIYEVAQGYYAFVMFYSNIKYNSFVSNVGAKTNGVYNAVATGDYAIFICTKTDYSHIDLTANSNVNIWYRENSSNNVGVIYMGNPNSVAPVTVDTNAKTIVFSDGTNHPTLLYQGRRVPVHGTLNIESLINNYGHIYYCMDTETFYTTNAGVSDFSDMPTDAVYIGSIWSGGTCINLNVYPFYLVNGVKTTMPDDKFLDVPWSVRIAVLGDSISTYVGYSEDSESGTAFIEEYYPRGNVDDVSKMWWEIVRKGLRSRYAPAISAVSRSSYRYQDNPLIPYGGDDDRITRLGMNGTPNYIFIELGTNDGFYNNYGDNPYQTDISTLETLKGTIYGGISTTINKVQNTYPSAEVIVLLPKFVSISAVNNPTYTFENYCKVCDAIAEIAKEFGCKVIDLRKSKINYRNVLSYTIDGIHPSAGGMAKIAEYVLSVMLGEK